MMSAPQKWEYRSCKRTPAHTYRFAHRGSSYRNCLPLKVRAPSCVADLKEAFGREPIAERIIPNIQRAHIEKNYRGAALIETHPAGAYLSKFAVGTQARGEGLSIELWRSVTAQHPALFWRSRLNNPINHWYNRYAQGHHDSGNWRVFWHGIAVDALPDVINYCVERESDFSN